MIVLHIRKKFRERASEWFCAGLLAAWGLTLLHPGDSFASPSYDAFQQLGEAGTGYLMGGLGIAWLVGLIINGAMQGPTSTLRIICAWSGAVIYGLLGIGFSYSFTENGILNAGVPICFLTSALALYSLYWIVVDKRING